MIYSAVVIRPTYSNGEEKTDLGKYSDDDFQISRWGVYPENSHHIGDVHDSD